jgi:hypothetical protein
MDTDSFLRFIMLSYMVNTRKLVESTVNMLLTVNMNKDTEMGYQNYYEYVFATLLS